MPRRPVWDDVPRTTAGQFAPRQRIGAASGPGMFRMIVVVIFTVLIHIVLAPTITETLNLGTLAMVLTFIGMLLAAVPIGFVLSQSWRWFFLYLLLAPIITAIVLTFAA